MKNIFLNFLSIIAIVIYALPCFAVQKAEYKFVPIKDEKTKIEFARTAVPKDFEVSSKIIWERDYKEPALLTIMAKSKENNVIFYYSSAKSYVDFSTENNSSKAKQDASLKVFEKKYQAPQEYVLQTLKSNNPNATGIKLTSETKFSNELIEYLTGELYQKLEEAEENAKTDKRASKIKITNPFIQPYIATYTYKINEKQYKQTFITMFSSMHYNYTKKTSYNEFETKVKKLWRNNGFYSYCAEIDKYNEYLDAFVMFLSDSMVNQKAKEAIDLVKKHMIIELNPAYIDIYTGSRLKKLPSELFRIYYLGGAPDYSEEQSALKPNISEIRWLSEYFEPQNCFQYRTITNLWNQNVYVPQKYKNIYYNKRKEIILISDEKIKLPYSWKKLKPSKIN